MCRVYLSQIVGRSKKMEETMSGLDSGVIERDSMEERPE